MRQFVCETEERERISEYESGNKCNAELPLHFPFAANSKKASQLLSFYISPLHIWRQHTQTHLKTHQ